MSDDDEPEPSRRGPLIAFTVIIVLVLATLGIARILHSSSAIQDCVMSGRTNCAPVR